MCRFSPQRSYSRLYTSEEHEAAVVIQSGYRGFRARQELKTRRALQLEGSRSRQVVSTGATYSRRVSSPQPTQSQQSHRVSQFQAFDSSGAPDQRSRVAVQRQPSGSTQEVREASRQESQRRAEKSSVSDGFRTVYEHRSGESIQPSRTISQGGRGVTQAGTSHTARTSTRETSPASSRSRSAVSNTTVDVGTAHIFVGESGAKSPTEEMVHLQHVFLTGIAVL